MCENFIYIVHLDNNIGKLKYFKEIAPEKFMYIYYLQRNRFFGARRRDGERHGSSGQASWCSRRPDSIVHLQQGTKAILLLTKLRLVYLIGLDADSNRALQFLKIHCSALRIIPCRNRQEKTWRRREPVEFFARYLLPSMGNRATGRTDMSSRHHAWQSTRVIHCISELSKAPFFSLIFGARDQMMEK